MARIFRFWARKGPFYASLLLLLLLLTGCEQQKMIITNVDEREANEIIVFLASKGIPCNKTPISTQGGVGPEGSAVMFNLFTTEQDMTQALGYLNQNGFPKKKGISLLDLFAKQGLMSSEKEETIRYQAGLAAQIASTIRKIDGVIDADVELSFPTEEVLPGEVQKERITASVYVKHQGIFDDPNSHLVSKIKRLVSGSVTGLDINDVTVISDRSRMTDLQVENESEYVSSTEKQFVSIWSIVMTHSSAGKFRFLFFSLLFLMILMGTVAGLLFWKCYPLLRQLGWKKMLDLTPFTPPAGSAETSERGSP